MRPPEFLPSKIPAFESTLKGSGFGPSALLSRLIPHNPQRVGERGAPGRPAGQRPGAPRVGRESPRLSMRRGGAKSGRGSAAGAGPRRVRTRGAGRGRGGHASSAPRFCRRVWTAKALRAESIRVLSLGGRTGRWRRRCCRVRGGYTVGSPTRAREPYWCSSPTGSCRIQATCVLLCTRAMTPQTPGRGVSGFWQLKQTDFPTWETISGLEPSNATLCADESLESDLTQESQAKTFREKMDSCIEAFGTTKQKRALNSRRMNTVGSESLNCAVAKAAENIIDAKGVTALVNDAIHDDLQDDSLYLPPCHADAAKPEDVYKFEDLLSTAEYEALQSPSEAFRNVSSEEILKMIEENSHCSFVIEALKSLPSDEKSRDRQARCIWFLDTLIKFRAQKVVKRKSALGPGIPHVINTKLLKHFTCLTYNNGSLRNLISDSMKAKITAYVIILALHISDFQIDLTMLQRDLKLSERRMIEIAKAMRLKISKRKVSLAAGREEDHKLGTLSIPLPPAQTSKHQSKRRKIT
uniref:RNA polymerase I subunit E n=1 Tax=Canis lupus familiaris TaxID=9615 RepID=A0A8P0SRY9_CANLF